MLDGVVMACRDLQVLEYFAVVFHYVSLAGWHHLWLVCLAFYNLLLGSGYFIHFARSHVILWFYSLISRILNYLLFSLCGLFVCFDTLFWVFTSQLLWKINLWDTAVSNIKLILLIFVNWKVHCIWMKIDWIKNGTLILDTTVNHKLLYSRTISQGLLMLRNRGF